MAKILVFDSGVGGLSILQALQQALPGCEYIYASDNQAFPYGTKSADFLAARVHAVLQGLIEQTRPDLIVVACNTASTLVLPHIRQHFTIPIVGVVPAIKTAAMQSKTGVIGLLGTPGTIISPYTKNLINEFAAHCEVLTVGSSELVALAESALRDSPPSSSQINTILKPLFNKPQLDTIVLACTHFPLLKDQLIKASPRPFHWIDSGEAIARRVSSLLPTHVTTNSRNQTSQYTAIFSTKNADIDSLRKTLMRFKLTNIDYIQV